jgi:transposase
MAPAYYGGMFFRTKKSPSGQTLQLTEAYRNEQGLCRQRVVTSLGSVAIDKEDQILIAKAVEARLYNQPQLFEHEYPEPIRQWIDRIVKKVDREGRWRKQIQIQEVQHKQSDPEAMDNHTIVDGVILEEVCQADSVVLGPCLLGLQAWQQLLFPELLKELGFNPSQIDAAAVSTISRLVFPGSEHQLLQWLPRTGLPELLQTDLSCGGKDRFYRVSDKLLKHQAAIEKHLQDRQKTLFHLDRTILLYDLTNTYFEGTAKANAKAKRGKSKHKRNDCPQIVIGMVFDRHGFELTHQIFEGNQTDSTTLVHMIETLQKQLDSDLLSEKPLVVVDAGVATKKNLKLLRKHNFDYLVNDSRRSRSQYSEAFAEEDGFECIASRDPKQQVLVKRIEDPQWTGDTEKPDTLVLCKSAGRLDKEQAIYSSIETKFLANLEKLKIRIETGRLKDETKIQQAIGRLKERARRVARFYSIELSSSKDTGFTLSWSRDDETYSDVESLFGCYVLRCCRDTLSADDLWRLYITLSRAEDGFRCLKSNLGLRPNFHQLEGRVDGHVFITVLAYHLHQYLMHQLHAQGDPRSWHTIRCILQTHMLSTTLLPTTQGNLYRIRKAGIPDASQNAIYKSLKIELKDLPVSKTMIELGQKATTL